MLCKTYPVARVFPSLYHFLFGKARGGVWKWVGWGRGLYRDGEGRGNEEDVRGDSELVGWFERAVNTVTIGMRAD